MNVNRLILIPTCGMILTGLVLLGGCGSSNPPSPTVVTGTASKGLIKNGTVKIYGVSDTGVKNGTPLATVQTDANGKYSADLGSYSGALVTEASGGYVDEATGTSVTIPADAPLRSAVALVDNGANNNRRIAVTPLTDLACGLMGSTFTASAISAANNRVGDLFKIKDIVGTQPVLPDTTGMGGADSDQKSYTMALATLSQMAKDASGGAAASFSQIQTISSSFKADMNASGTSGLGAATVNAFKAALASVSTTMMPGFELAAANLATVGTTTFKLTVSAAGVPTGTMLGTIHGVITVPSGADMRIKSSGEVLDGLIAAAGTAATGSPQVIGNFNKTTRQLTFDVISPSAGFANGECAVITFDVTTGTSVAVENFIVNSAQGKDYSSAATVSGVTINLR